MLKKMLRKVARERDLEGKLLNLMLVSDSEIRKLNRQFLKRSGATDVIAFPGENLLLGEIAISIDTASRQASERKIPLNQELKLLAIHGLLHLDGIDDESFAGWRRMRKAEFEEVIKVL